MKDCKSNDINIGDRVAFTVGIVIKTGVATTGDGYYKHYYGREYPAVRVALDVPDHSYSRGQLVEKTHRVIFEAFRILKL